MTDLDKYKHDDAELTRLIRAAENELMRLRHERTQLRLKASPVQVGDVVNFSRRRGWEDAIVRRIEPREPGTKPHIYVSVKKKGGGWSAVELCAYSSNWEVKSG